MKPGQTFTTTLAGGPDGELIFWATTDDGGWLVTWASRHGQDFKPEEGPKPSSEPFVIYDYLEAMGSSATPDDDTPHLTPLTTGHRWASADRATTGVVIDLDAGHYVARDEAYNGISVMATQYRDRVDALSRWKARDGRKEAGGRGQPPIGPEVKVRIPEDVLSRIDEAVQRGTYRTRSQAIRQMVMESVGLT